MAIEMPAQRAAEKHNSTPINKRDLALPAKASARRNGTAQEADDADHIPDEFVAEIFNGKGSLAGLKARADLAYGKGSAALAGLREVAKDNLEALKASGKVLGSGTRELGASSVADGRIALETLKGDLKGLGALKSPADVLRYQTRLLRRNFEAAIALTSRNGQTLQKLAKETVAPLSKRVVEVTDKVRKHS